MTNFIDLNVLNFFVSISNKGFHILDSIMIFFTVLGDDGHIFIAASIILLIFKKTRSLGILLAISLLLTLAVSTS
jgi:undecaprenyl-diphosphatase